MSVRRRPGPARSEILLARPQRDNRLVTSNAERWEVRADRVGDVRRRKVRVVLFRHPRIRMAKLFGNDAHRHATHGRGSSRECDAEALNRPLGKEVIASADYPRLD